MNTIALLVVASLAAGGAWILYARWRGRSTGAESASPRTAHERPVRALGRTSRFACVEIKLTADSCDAARALVGKVLLARDAPALPLEGCNRHCRCAFEKRADRRQERRRWSDEGIAAMLYSAKERRKRADRRRS